MTIEQFFSTLELDGEHSSLSKHISSFHRFASNLDVAALVEDELTRSNNEYKYPPRVRSRYALVLGGGSWFVLELVVIRSNEFVDPITTEVSDGLYHFVSNCEAIIYQLLNYENEGERTDAVAVPRSCLNLQRGTTISINSQQEALSLRASQPVLALVLSSKYRNLFGWDFSAVSGKPIQRFNNHASMTMYELMAHVMGSYGGDNCVKPLKRLLEHRSDTVKWEAASALLKIRRPDGLDAFRRLAGSTHQSLARSALAVVRRIEENV